MLTERLQILVSPDQRLRLEAEARRRGTSVGALVREAVDAQLGGFSQEERLKALDDIRQMRADLLGPDELNRIVAEERELEFTKMTPPPRS